MIYFCCDEYRREAVRRHKTLNGIDFLEVLDDPTMPNVERQRKLYVHFIKPLDGGRLNKENIRIDGGERIFDVLVKDVTATAGQQNVLTVNVNKAGDFSTYILRLIVDAEHPQPPAGFDPLLSAIEFSFKVACPNDFDCRTEQICPPEVFTAPEIDYMAKDYASFRQLMLDRMAILIPQWQERNPADLGIALVELLAYVGDYLSYQQDAIATEAYLGTARRRVSVRRHARLVDYFMHDGCNARVWVQVQVSADVARAEPGDPLPLPVKTRLLTRVAGMPSRIPTADLPLGQALTVFETMHDVEALYIVHNEIHFYTWGAERCCLPKGATRASLQGHLPNLKAGDVMIFEEVLGPQTGEAVDANPAHRQAVYLKSVELTSDPLGGQFASPPNDSPVDVTEIVWAADDALLFPLCISSRTDLEHGERLIENVSVARGNIVLADHGLTVEDELGSVPSPSLVRVPATGGNRCQEQEPRPIPARFRPRLPKGPLTQAAPYDQRKPPASASVNPNGLDKVSSPLPYDQRRPPASASAAMRWTTRDPIPAITLHDKDDVSSTWSPRRDLLNSDATAREFVMETEADGTSYLRFGDDEHGMRPIPGTAFVATYRIGNGSQGNIGADSLAHIVIDEPNIVAVRNLLPAQGGVEPESIEDVRQKAPWAFRTQKRAVTPADYAEVAQRCPGVRCAAATFRWTGSWRTVFLAIDRQGGAKVDDGFKQDMYRYMEPFRMAGYDLEIDGPLPVSLEIEMQVCVQPDYFRGDVKAALLEVFSNRVLPDGRLGVFHPDKFTFGQPVYLSRLYAAAMAVKGVASVKISTFQRQGIDSNAALAAGKLLLGRLEIARLDNDPDFPEHGVFRLIMEGGK